MCLGIPGRIIETRDDQNLLMGVVDFGGVRREVCLAYVDGEAAVGDYVMVHVGFAISRVDTAEAERTFQLLEKLEGPGDPENSIGPRDRPAVGNRS